MQVSDTSKTIAIVLAIIIVGLSATGAWFYINLKKENKNHDSYQYKQSQIDECMQHGPTFTDKPTLEANYQEKVDYCSQLNR